MRSETCPDRKQSVGPGPRKVSFIRMLEPARYRAGVERIDYRQASDSTRQGPSPPGGFTRPCGWGQAPLRASLPTRGDDHSQPGPLLGARTPTCSSARATTSPATSRRREVPTRGRPRGRSTARRRTDRCGRSGAARTAPSPWNSLLGEDRVPSPSGVTVTADTTLKLSAVFGCVRLLSDVVSTLPLHVYRTCSREPLDPAPAFLARPAAGMDIGEWVQAAMWSLPTRGNGSGLIVARTRAAQRPVQKSRWPGTASPSYVEDRRVEWGLDGRPVDRRSLPRLRPHRLPGQPAHPRPHRPAGARRHRPPRQPHLPLPPPQLRQAHAARGRP